MRANQIVVPQLSNVLFSAIAKIVDAQIGECAVELLNYLRPDILDFVRERSPN